MKYFFCLALSLGIVIMSCNDSIEVGSEILENNLDVQVDLIDITAQLVFPDSIQTFNKNASDGYSTTRYMVGEMEDDAYGVTESILYFNVSLLSNLPEDIADFQFDSVVMILPYDTLGSYGPDGTEFDISLHQLVEPFQMMDDEKLYSTDGLEFEMIPDFSGAITVNHRDSVSVGNHLQDTLGVVERPQLRLPLDPQKWMEIFQDKDTLDRETIEMEAKGYALKASSSDKNSLIGLGMQYQASSSTSNMGVIRFYLKENDDDMTPRVYNLNLGRFRQSQFIHDYAGSNIETIIANNSQEEMYLQSQGGVEIELDLSGAKDDTDFILNSASIEFAIIEIEPQDAASDYPAPVRIFAKHLVDGVERVVDDFSVEQKFSEIREREEVGGETVRFYKIDITNHVTQILNEEVDTDKIILFPQEKSTRPFRVKLCGPEHPLYPTRLTLVKTTI